MKKNHTKSKNIVSFGERATKMNCFAAHTKNWLAKTTFAWVCFLFLVFSATHWERSPQSLHCAQWWIWLLFFIFYFWKWFLVKLTHERIISFFFCFVFVCFCSPYLHFQLKAEAFQFIILLPYRRYGAAQCMHPKWDNTHTHIAQTLTAYK